MILCIMMKWKNLQKSVGQIILRIYILRIFFTNVYINILIFNSANTKYVSTKTYSCRLNKYVIQTCYIRVGETGR